MTTLELVAIVGTPVATFVSAVISSWVTTKKNSKDFAVNMQNAAQNLINTMQGQIKELHEQITDLYEKDKKCLERNDRLELEIQELQTQLKNK